jgi:hypothetical protein
MAPLEIAELESRMRPGAFSRAGFLGPQESLLQVLEADRQQVARMGLTFEQLAEPLEALIAAGVSSPSRKTNVGKVYRVEVEVLTGFQICPWAADPHHAQCTAGKGVQNASVNWRIINRQTGQELRGPGLAGHLLRDHHFCQGRGSPLRVDPLVLAEFLGLR